MGLTTTVRLLPTLNHDLYSYRFIATGLLMQFALPVFFGGRTLLILCMTPSPPRRPRGLLHGHSDLEPNDIPKQPLGEGGLVCYIYIYV